MVKHKARRSIANAQATRLGSVLSRRSINKTFDGFCYRVDMRTCPFGESGPLVMSYAALGRLLPRARPTGNATRWLRRESWAVWNASGVPRTSPDATSKLRNSVVTSTWKAPIVKTAKFERIGSGVRRRGLSVTSSLALVVSVKWSLLPKSSNWFVGTNQPSRARSTWNAKCDDLSEFAWEWRGWPLAYARPVLRRLRTCCKRWVTSRLKPYLTTSKSS